MNPYVIVIHTPTQRAFTLDRSYKILTPLIEKAYPAMFGELEHGEKWEGWLPSYEYQRPPWTHELDSQEFTAWWYKESTK